MVFWLAISIIFPDREKMPSHFLPTVICRQPEGLNKDAHRRIATDANWLFMAGAEEEQAIVRQVKPLFSPEK